MRFPLSQKIKGGLAKAHIRRERNFYSGAMDNFKRILHVPNDRGWYRTKVLIVQAARPRPGTAAVLSEIHGFQE